ncbi:MAG TPA: branched-chain amino acid ABC transporter permease [Thermodesulfobacteriota bacterium]|nr:branched-chain amino acid ABC transporter permease [Thermodesulfobacteriota bacterium]
MYFFNQLISGLAIGSIYSLLGLGFTMIFACTRRINFAHGDLMALGGFLGLFFFGLFPSAPMVAFIVAPLMNGLITAGVERVFFRRLQEAQPLKIVIATIGFSIILKIIMKIVWGTDPIAYPPLISEKTFSFFGVGIVPQTLVILWVALFLMIVLQVFFLYTKSGRGLRAFSQDRYAARLMGIRIGWSISLTYFISGILAGIAGMLIGPVFFISSTMGTHLGLKSFVAAVIGGLGNIPGTIAGGLFLGVVENYSSGFISSNYKNGIALSFLVLVLLFRPQGLLSGFQKGKLLFRRRAR